MPKTFNTLQEIFNYIPKCIICGKDMILRIKLLDNVFSKYETDLLIKNKQVVSKKNEYELSINIYNNKIIEGETIFNTYNNISLKKICKTCSIDVVYFPKLNSYKSQNLFFNGIFEIKNNCFPEMVLAYESLQFTAKNGKRIYLSQDYRDSILYGTAPSSIILLEGLSLSSIYIDFEKINNLKQLNKRINMIKIFQ